MLLKRQSSLSTSRILECDGDWVGNEYRARMIFWSQRVNEELDESTGTLQRVGSRGNRLSLAAN